MAEEKEKKVEVIETDKPLNLAKRVTIRNTTNIDTYFRQVLKSADAKVAKKGTMSLSVEEILAQCDNGNPSFVGHNRDGSHASLYIEDAEVRKYLGFDTDKSKQEVIDEQAILQIFDASSISAFANQLKEKILTMGEKQTLRDVIASDKVDSHQKIELATAYLRGETLEVAKGKPGRPKKSE